MNFKYGRHSKAGGIYQIKNLTNHRIYIGSAAKFTARWSQHKKDLLRGKHGNKFLQNDFNKCGTDAFEFSVLQVVIGDKVVRQKAEQRFIDDHYDDQKLCYNFLKQAAPSREHIANKNPEETKRLLSNAAKQTWEKLAQDPHRLKEYKKNASAHAKRNHSNPEISKKIRDSHSKPEVRKVMSDKAKERMADPAYRDHIAKVVTERHATDPEYRAKNLKGLENARKALKSPEVQEKLRLATIERVAKQKANARTVVLIDPEGNEVVIHNLSDWCRQRGFANPGFYSLAAGKVLTCKGYKLQSYKIIREQVESPSS